MDRRGGAGACIIHSYCTQTQEGDGGGVEGVVMY